MKYGFDLIEQSTMDERAKKMEGGCSGRCWHNSQDGWTLCGTRRERERDTRRPGDNHTHEQRTFKKIAHRSRERPGYEWRIRRGEVCRRTRGWWRTFFTEARYRKREKSRRRGPGSDFTCHQSWRSRPRSRGCAEPAAQARTRDRRRRPGTERTHPADRQRRDRRSDRQRRGHRDHPSRPASGAACPAAGTRRTGP
jgi:hypothetical protein